MPTCEDRKRWNKEYEEYMEKLNAEWKEKYKDVPPKYPPLSSPIPEPKKERCDSPYTMEDSTATFLWIVVMVVGSIFKGNWVIWIISTIVWRKFITRHDR